MRLMQTGDPSLDLSWSTMMHRENQKTVQKK